MAEGFFEFRQRVTRKSNFAPAPEPRAGAAAITVTQLTRQIERAIKTGMPDAVLVKGEVSNLSLHGPSGHLYFTLKDPDACIDCVMWKSDAERMKFKPQDGMELLASGRVGVYPQRGRYQLYVTSLQPIGQGALELAFQQLRKKLDGEGLFAVERKKPLPAYPVRIALVTAEQGASLADMLKVLRRFAWLRLMLFPVAVQGDGCGERIAAALRLISRRAGKVGGVDLIMLARGGGSLEDLWGFNEEVVARAIAASSIPIITGIGHEVDVSIADLVADYHAHTPTEAAQVITANWRSAREVLDDFHIRLGREMRSIVDDSRTRLNGLRRHEFFRRPFDRVKSLRQLLDDRDRTLRTTTYRRMIIWQRRLTTIEQAFREHTPATQVRLLRQRVANLAQRLLFASRMEQQRRGARLDALERELRALSPESILRRGFSVTTLKKDGKIVRSVAQIKGGERLVTRLADGTIESTADDPKQPKLF